MHDEDDEDDKKRFFPPDSIQSKNILLDFFEKVLFILFTRKILSELIKVRNNSFGQTQFGPTDDNSKKRFFPPDSFDSYLGTFPLFKSPAFEWSRVT